MSSAHSVTINVSCEAAVGPDRPSEWAEQLCITVNSFHIVSDNTTLKNGHACYLVPWSPTILPPVIMPPQPPPHLTLDNFNIESEVPENCPFVLTSPRSLEACRRAGVQVGCCHSITLGNKPYYYYYYTIFIVNNLLCCILTVLSTILTHSRSYFTLHSTMINGLCDIFIVKEFALCIGFATYFESYLIVFCMNITFCNHFFLILYIFVNLMTILAATYNFIQNQ